MITESFLVVSIFTLVALGLIATGFVMMHAAHAAAVGRRLAGHLEQGRLIIAAAVSSNTPPADADLAVLLSLPRSRVISLVSELTRSFKDEENETIQRIARDLHITTQAIEFCGSRRWWRRLEGTRLLELFDAGHHLRPQLLQDRHPLVRAQAAEWSAQDAKPAELGMLIGLLGDPDGLTRHSAKDALIRIGDPAAPFVADELERSEGSAAIAVLEVAASINDARLLPGALRLSADDEPHTRALATRVLGTIGGGEALDRLSDLLCDQHPQVRAEAARALGHLSHWRRGPELAALLEDSSWEVRRESGLALGSIGAPGRLLLRRARSSTDEFAADMAHQVLDLLEIQQLAAS